MEFSNINLVRLQKLAFYISDDLELDNKLQKSFELYKHYARERKQFFNSKNFDALSFLILFLMIWSIKVSGDLTYWENIISPNLFFISFFVALDDHPFIECDDCNGNSYVDCNECDGSGNETCNECNGDGEVTCTECDGKGEVDGENGPEECEYCDGSGEYTCDKCEGSGSVSCRYCDDGRVDCDSCDGDGEVVDEDVNLWEIHLFVSWNKDINNLTKTSLKEREPLSNQDFSTYSYPPNTFLFERITADSQGDELGRNIDTNKYYPTEITDTPNISMDDLFNFSTNSKNVLRIIRGYYLL